MITRVKICGITSEKDIGILNKHKPDFAGFVFAESRRKTTAEAAKNLGSLLDPMIMKAGVFVDMDQAGIAEIVEITRLDIVQLHGNETQDYIDRLRTKLNARVKIWKAFRISGAGSVKEMSAYRTELFLADTFVKGMQGGSGRRFDWSLLMNTQERQRIIMAGGLSPENVKEAISTVRPYGVDVSSGVEADGIKNELLVGEFIRQVREMRMEEK